MIIAVADLLKTYYYDARTQVIIPLNLLWNDEHFYMRVFLENVWKHDSMFRHSEWTRLRSLSWKLNSSVGE